MKKYGLLGEKLAHSFSPQIHGMLGEYAYDLYEVPGEDLARFLQNEGDLAGMNVTIPYKKAVLPYCSFLSEGAKRIGSVNTLVRREDGWHGYNTDHFGFRYLVESKGYSVAGKKGLVLGSGGASLAVRAALQDMGAKEIVTISRSGENNYDNLFLHEDARVLVNTTPVGMYPQNGAAPVSLDAFPHCEAVFDIVYNPRRTQLLLQAQRRGLIHQGGLSMLVAQAYKSAELFTGREIPKARIEEVLHALSTQMENIILVGMPGCGKTSIGKLLAQRTGRPFLDADEELEKAMGKSPAQIIQEQGEAAFRAAETRILSDLGKRSGCVIATGGGCVTREENDDLLHQNGKIFWIRRSLEKLPTDGRPLSQQNSLETLYRQREALYARFADGVVENDGSIEAAADKIWEAIK